VLRGDKKQEQERSEVRKDGKTEIKREW